MNDDPTVLLTARGQELLSRLATERAGRAGTSLALAERLRREYPAELVAAAMSQQELRQAAAAKFSRAADMLFTRAGYEQASSETIARYRAGRFQRFKEAARIADLCCGIGGDLIALAEPSAETNGRPSAETNGRTSAGTSEVLAVDRDETHARLAVHNAAVYGAAGQVKALIADVREVPLAGIDAVFIDPARRSGQGTASAANAGRYKPGWSEPPLNWCTALTETVPAVGIKAAPGIPADSIPDRWEAEFIAESRDLKEAVLWSPALATAPPIERGNSRGPRRATVLLPATVLRSGPDLKTGTVLKTGTADNPPRSYTLVAHEGSPVALREPGEYLLDPNPAVTRAGLVEDLARTLGPDAAKIDPQIAFLTLDAPVATPFARTLRVQHSAPWHEKSFAKRLRELDIGAVDIRRRGLAGDVDQIRRRLKLAGQHRATVVITRVNDKPWGLICADAAG